MIHQLKNPDFYIIITIDLLLFLLAHAGSYIIRFDLLLAGTTWSHLWELLPLLMGIKLLCFIAMDVYKGMWRYVSINDLFIILKASTVSSLILITMILIIYRFEGFSRGMFLLDWLLTFVFVGGSRIIIRQCFNSDIFNNNRSKGLTYKSRPIEKNVIIIGAGDAGEKILREIRDNRELDYRVVGFVDDDLKKIGKSIHGVSVMGKIDELPAIVEKEKVAEALIAIPSATGAQKLRVVDICKSACVDFKTLPGMSEIIDGRVSIKSLRDVCYEDLLGRPTVTLNDKDIRDYLFNKIVLVTGAGGSIGSELCRRIIEYKPLKMVLVDSSEANLYSIQMDMKHNVMYTNYVTVLANVSDSGIMEWTMKSYKPEVVFHAAAYKHVPMIERNPWQAVYNNILGAQIMMELSVKYCAERFILVSTDKAVRPTNVMGASKRVCEKLLYSFMGGYTRLMAVRFGNVVGSAGSVIPLFRKQIEAGGPVTVTHPEVTRFFMTIPEAAQLILQAGSLGTGGEVFILEMGTPVKIADMARDLIRLSGKEPERDIEIKFDKLRPGEKLYEELITEGEGIVVTSHKKIMVLKSEGCFNSYGDQDGYRRWLDEHLAELYAAAETYNSCLIKKRLKAIVPEYEIQETECVF